MNPRERLSFFVFSGYVCAVNRTEPSPYTYQSVRDDAPSTIKIFAKKKKKTRHGWMVCGSHATQGRILEVLYESTRTFIGKWNNMFCVDKAAVRSHSPAKPQATSPPPHYWYHCCTTVVLVLLWHSSVSPHLPSRETVLHDIRFDQWCAQNTPTKTASSTYEYTRT